MIFFNKMLNFKSINLKWLIRFLPNNNVSFSTQSVPVTCEPFMNGTSASYIEKLYWEWKTNPQSVHMSWQAYFKLVESDAPPGCAYQSPVRAAIILISSQPATKAKGKPSPVIKPQPTKLQVVTTDAPVTGTKLGTLKDHLNLFSIVESYQTRGHLMSNLDPLQIHRGPNIKKRLDTEHNVVLQQNQMPTDLSIKYKLPSNTYIGGTDTELTLKEIVYRLDQVYCGSIGVELNHLGGLDQEVFLKKLLESRVTSTACLLTNEQRITVLDRLLKAHHFELYLSKKWPSEKRFGLEGCDVYVPAMRHIMEVASDVGGEHFVMGMAHRGRLNTLANIMEVPAVKIFSTFRKIDPGVLTGEGDVKYHLGATTKIKHSRKDKYMRVSLCANPSHLESVNPIVTGKTAGEQLLSNDVQHNKVWPILVHGDAAVCGQGVVYETCHLSELSCYKTGGTVHVVINNQIGFTTDPYLSRSSEYCTAVAKVVNAPIFHVNSDEVDDVISVCEIATKYRAKFNNDVVIDLVCYRRNGHNEGDEPMFTQPIMYKVIKDTIPVYFKYKEKLLAEKVISSVDVKKLEDNYNEKLDKGFEEASKSPHIDPYDWLSSPWEGFNTPDKDPLKIPSTGIEQEVFDQICTSISKPPPNLKIHRGIERSLKNRQTMVKNKMVDWAVGESLAFASLLQEGIFVRLSGQDVERGTFSHRHHVLHDQEADKRVNVLENIFPNQAKYSLCNSSLSEFGVLGFEYGMTFTNPDALIIWEGQFGDFINSAQIIIDQYLSSSEGKWFQQSGIVLLLPHGMEGQGPEHSSGRPERFLQLCNDDDIHINTNMPEQMHKGNWFIVNASTPANFFHVLRRQVKLNYRKPLIVFSPKFLLRYPGCVSRADEFIGDTQFKPYISDPDVPASPNVTKLLLCTGKIYYELKETRQERKLGNEIAIGRIEQLSPLPYSDIMEDAFEKYPNARLFWVQEEHKNQGGWSYISPRLNKLLGKKKGSVTYIGRIPSASPATGHKLVHPKEREQLLVAAMTL